MSLAMHDDPAPYAHDIPADTAPDAPATPESHETPPGTASAPRPAPRRRRLVRRAVAGIAGVALLVSVFAAGVGMDRTGLLGGPAADAAVADAQDFGLVREAWDLLHEKYVGADDLDSRELAYGAIEGLTGAVDDPGHTSFMTPEERERSHQALSGSFVGVGIQVEDRDGDAVIVSVLRGSPAAAAGLLQDDRIVAVDGTSVLDADLEDVVSMVRGAEGTSVALTVERDGSEDRVEVTMVRARITQPAVSWERVPGTEVVMLRVEGFSSGSADEFKAALEAVLATQPGGIVLDLRGNGGGYINEAIAVASQFLDEGDVHLSRDAQGTITPTAVFPDGLAPDVPLVVLVDGASASSAEIVAGALQDPGRAELVGERTFGTGTVLSEVPLSDGSALRIGVIEWLTPEGRSIWREGLTPDTVVALPEGATPIVPEDLAGMGPIALKHSSDAQLLKALDILEAEIGATGDR